MHDLPTISPRYQLRSVIGMGGMGVVYEAYDRIAQREVALKRVHVTDSPVGLSTEKVQTYRVQLAREFKVLASLHHPNIIQVLDYGFDVQGVPYFTMDLLTHTQTILQATENKSLAVKYDQIIQLIQAIQYLHRHGMLHRDLKPSNILVVNGVVKVLDFGLAIKTTEKSGTAGTLSYMAPETLQENRVSEQSDLYSVAVIAYEVLAEDSMYPKSNVSQLLAHVLGIMPPTEQLPVPLAVQRVLADALQKKPQARPRTIQAFLSAFSRAIGNTSPLETPDIRESFLQGARFVGREQELDILTHALKISRNGHGSAWLIAGESGVGKSRLMAEVRTQALVNGMVVLHGQAISDGGLPFQVWLEPLRWLAILGDLSNDEANALKGVLSDLDSPLKPSTQSFSIRDAHAEQARFFSTILGIFRRLPFPTMLILEDLQWASEESLQLLARLSDIVAELPLFIMGNYRDDEFLYPSQSLRNMQVLRLQRFDRDEISLLSEAMLGQSNPRLVNFLQEQTEGNIFFLLEIIRTMAEKSGNLDGVESYNLPTGVLTAGIQRIARYRLNLIPAGAQRLLEIAAVVGRYIDLNLLHTLAPETDLELWLSDCSYRVLDMANGRWRFMHDKVRETLLIDLAPSIRRDLHLLVAQTIEGMYGVNLDTLPALAYHWGVAGHPAKEARYALQTAQNAETMFGFANARQYYLQALEAYSQTTESDKDYGLLLDTLIGLVRVSLLSGDPRVNLSYISLAEDIINPEDSQPSRQTFFNLMRLYALTGQAHYYGAEYTEALQWFEKMRLMAQTIREKPLVSVAEGLRGRILALQGYFEQAVPLLAQGVPSTDQKDNWHDWIWNHAYYGFTLGMAGYTDEAIAVGNEALLRSQEIHFDTGEAICRIFLMTTFWQANQFNTALAECQLVLDIAMQSGDNLPLHLAYGFQAWILTRKGEPAYATESFERYEEIVNLMGGQLVFADWFMALRAEMALANKHLAEATHYAQQAVQFSQQTGGIFAQALALRVLGSVLLQQGLVTESVPHFEQSKALFTSGHALYESQRTELAQRKIPTSG